VNKRFVVLSALMLLVAANCIAMSLGRHRGAALIGRPLDISVQAVMDAQEDIASLCLEADVFYADNKLDKSRVRVTAERATPGSQDVVIRIRSGSLVDEPVVTFYLRVGCQQKTERRYVTLAELASEPVTDRSVPAPAPPPLQLSPPVVTMPAAGSPTTSPQVAKPLRPTGRAANSDAAAAPRVLSPDEAANADSLKKSRAPNAERPARKQEGTLATATAKPGASTRPRLKLEPLDLTIDRDPQLRPSAELLTAPSSSPQERSAAAALWRALNAQPEDMLRDAEKLQTLESAVRSLQSQSQKTQRSIDDLGIKLQTAQSERYANPLVYALVFLLLLALGGLAYLMRGRLTRGRPTAGDAPWWRKNEIQQNQRSAWADSGVPDDDFESEEETGLKKFNSDASGKSKSAIPDLDLNFAQPELKASKQVSKPDNDLDSVSAQPMTSKYSPDFALSMSHPSRAVKAEELFDVQQQADFFVSIGQHEQAIEVLRNHIGDSIETSALVYLDLFNLYHQLARKDDYAALRDDFNRRFNTKVPVFEMYTDAGPGLEAYQIAMSRIAALWPSAKVLEIIEESIFRKPDNNSEAFNLEAYRELLMLYSVAKEIIHPEPKPPGRPPKFDLPDAPEDSEDSQPMSFLSTSIQPLSASIEEEQAEQPGEFMEPFMVSTIPPASLNLGLDLDLSEPGEASGNSLPLDVSDAEFFAQFDKSMSAGQPVTQSVTGSRASIDSDNLIDFDAFDSSLNATQKTKPPKS
jgi:hypothetical protein